MLFFHPFDEIFDMLPVRLVGGKAVNLICRNTGIFVLVGASAVPERQHRCQPVIRLLMQAVAARSAFLFMSHFGSFPQMV